MHRTRSLHPLDVWRHRGVPVTSPARTLLDLAAVLDDLPLRRAMSRAQSLRLTSLRSLGQQIDRSHGRAVAAGSRASWRAARRRPGASSRTGYS